MVPGRRPLVSRVPSFFKDVSRETAIFELLQFFNFTKTAVLGETSCKNWEHDIKEESLKNLLLLYFSMNTFSKENKDFESPQKRKSMPKSSKVNGIHIRSLKSK